MIKQPEIKIDKLAAMTAFITVVESMSFTDAAEKLGVARARVSQRVSDLEQYLGVRLLQRTTRSLQLTEEGKLYFAQCQEILQEIDSLEETLKGSANAPSGHLRIEALASVARWIIAPQLHHFKKLYPNITIHLGSGDRISHLLNENIDCAIRGGHLPDSSLIARHICDVSLGLYAAPEYLEEFETPQHPSELEQHQLLSWFSNQREFFAWKLKTNGDTYDILNGQGLEFDDPEIAIATCQAAGGICPAAPFAVEESLRAGKLVTVLPDWSFQPRPMQLIYPSKRQLSVRVRCFIDWALQQMKEHKSMHMNPQELVEWIANKKESS